MIQKDGQLHYLSDSTPNTWPYVEKCTDQCHLVNQVDGPYLESIKKYGNVTHMRYPLKNPPGPEVVLDK